METTHLREYKSPRRKLLRFFEKSRDKWKLKYREVKKVLKRLTNRIGFLERSKAEYKRRVEELQAQLAALKASCLEKEEANEALKKRGDQPAPPLQVGWKHSLGCRLSVIITACSRSLRFSP